jgi:hypothetical protein
VVTSVELHLMVTSPLEMELRSAPDGCQACGSAQDHHSSDVMQPLGP